MWSSLVNALLFLISVVSVMIQLHLCIAQPTISAISGCQTDPSNLNLTINCDLPVNLTIIGNGFTNAMTVGVTTTSTSFRCDIVTANPSLNTVYCYLYFRGTSWIPWQRFTNLTVTDLSVTPNLASVPFAGVTFLPTVPVLTGITGCTDTSNTTINCMPANTTLTLIGANFSKLRPFYTIFSIRVISTGISFGLGQSLTLLDDSHWLLNLANIYSSMFPLNLYATSVAIAVGYGSDYTNSASFSLALLPPPQISAITGINCLSSRAQIGSLTVINSTDCYPSFSLLSITGAYLYTVPITVGGWPCLVNQYNRDPTIAQGNLVVCLPTLDNSYTAGTLMDVTLNRTVLVTAPAVVSFNSLPTIISLSAADCPGDATGWNTYTNLKCAAGATITINGWNFLTDPVSTAALIIQLWDRTHSTFIQCLQLVIVNTENVTCVLPLPPDNSDAFEQFYFSGTASTSIVLFYNQSFQSNVFPAGIYQSLNAPTVNSVTGCTSTSPPSTAITGCQVGNILTLTGSNFIVGSDVQYGTVWSCEQVNVVSWNQLTCVIKEMGSLSTGQAYPVVVTVHINGTLLASNAFFLSFAASPPPSSSSNSLNATTTAIAVVVVIFAVSISAGTGVYIWWRRVRRHNRSGAGKNWLPREQPHSDDNPVTELESYSLQHQ